MHKKILATFVFVVLTVYTAVAQKGITISPAAFKGLTGCWQGTLNYSGTIIRKPYTTSAELVVRQIGKTSGFQFLHIYTKDTKDNAADTIKLSANGRKLNQAAILSRRQTRNGATEIITEALGFDHDNNKAAIIRQTYTIAKNVYIYKKQVKPEGQTDWLDREEFTYTRKTCNE